MVARYNRQSSNATGDLIEQHRVDIYIDVIPSDDCLPLNGDILDLDVHNTHGFRTDVNFDKTWIDS